MNATDKKSRAAIRYEYEVQAEAQSQVTEENFSVSLVNISSSGIQIKTSEELAEGEKINITWQDFVQGNIEGVFYLARAVENEDSPLHFYGLRYYRLSDKYKKSILLVLNALKKTSRQNLAQSQSGEEDILKTIENAENLLQEHLSGSKESPGLVSQKAHVIKPYEKEAFSKSSNVYDTTIVSYAVANFKCMLFSDAVEGAINDSEFAEQLLSGIKAFVDQSIEIESKEEEVFAFLKKSKSDSKQRLRYNESSNRLFYAKHALFEKVIKDIPVRHLSKSGQKAYKFISDSYDPSIGPEETIVDWEPSKEQRITPETFQLANQQNKTASPKKTGADIKLKSKKKNRKKKKKKIKNFQRRIGFLGWVLRFLVLITIGMLAYYVFMM